MTSIVEGLRLVIEQVITTIGYGGIALIMLLENLIPPIPAEFVLPFTGFLVEDGRLAFLPVLLVSTLGSFVGTAVFYLLGRRWGEGPLLLWFARYGSWIGVQEVDVVRVLMLFRQHDRYVVFWARFIPGMRSIISLPAGIAGMPFGRFAGFTLAGTLLWNGLLIGSGVLLGEHWARMLLLLERGEPVLWLLVLLLVAGSIFRHRLRLSTFNR